MKSPESEPKNAACLPNDELSAFLRGQLDEDKLETIAQHLTLCSACADGLRFLSTSDNFVQLVRRSVLSSSHTVETACLVLEERAREIPSRGTAMTTEIVRSADTVIETPPLPLPFGGYVLMETLGEGGMGIVYKAKQGSLKRFVALKRIRGGIYAGKEERERFQREGEAIASVEHPHVVKIHEFGEYQGQPFFSMELLEGGTLSKKLNGQPLPEREAAELVRTLALTIATAHRRGILHRDLKPSNVLFAGDGTPKISDFGLAKVMDNDSDVTRSDDVLGTPAYMSPEQARGEVRRLGPTTDVYSLGAILYETLTGRPPFRGESRLHTLELVRTREPVSPRRHRPNVSRDLEAICLKCLEKKSERRYSSGEELAADLQRYLDGRTTHARPLSVPRRLGRTISRHPLSTSAFCLGLMLALTAIFLYRLHDPKNALETIQKRLRDGQEVDLLDKNGRPFYSQWESAKGILEVYEHEHAVSLAAVEPTLLTLVLDPQNDYRFSAEVQHESTTQQSEVGLFFAHSRYLTPEGVMVQSELEDRNIGVSG
jgi:serine/threonine protein kinase